jgi:16S rRNA (cytosine967-C5)-methyltransferase
MTDRALRLAPPLRRVLGEAAPALAAVLAGQSLDRALGERQSALDAKDPEAAALRGAVRDVATEAVRRLAHSRYFLGRLAQRAVDPDIEALILTALALIQGGTYTDFTVVDQSVALARSRPEMAAASGFVNAVLRNFLRRRAQLGAEVQQDDARARGLPAWWWQRLIHDLGHEGANRVAQAQVQAPPLVLRVNTRRLSVADYLDACARRGQAAVQVGPQAVHLLNPVPVQDIEGFAQGIVSVQDAGAQIAARVLGVEPGMRVLDACAAPGGKTGHMAELAACRIDAIDRDAIRLQRIGDNLRRLGGIQDDVGVWGLGDATVRVFSADAAHPDAWWDGQAYQSILLDAPCTGSGIVRRHPDALWLRRPQDVANLATRQAAILDALWPLLAPAGRFLYVVCSVFSAEGPDGVRAFLDRTPNARLVPLQEQAASPDGSVAGGDVGLDTWRLLPDSGRLAATPESVRSDQTRMNDGFFYALLEKTGP